MIRIGSAPRGSLKVATPHLKAGYLLKNGVPYSENADITEYYADQAEVITADQPLTILGEGTAVIRRSPLGVLFGIMPWNFPYYQVARFAAPNLVLGNVIVLKHASQCPESAAAIEAIYRDAGLPEGAYLNVYVSNEQAATIIADPRIQGVSVTGSQRAGARSPRWPGGT